MSWVDVYLGMAQRRLADALSADGQDAAALAAYALARGRLELGAAVAPEAWPSLREQVLSLLGSAPLLHSQGRADEAAIAIAEALTMLDSEHQRTGPANVWERSHRARALLLRCGLEGDRGGFGLALGDAQAALTLAAALSSSDRDDMQSLLLRARAQSELGRVMFDAGRAAEAALVVGEALPALEQIVRQEPRHAQAQCELALACQRMALALSGREPELAGPWQARGRELVDELDSARRLAPRDRARLAEWR